MNNCESYTYLGIKFFPNGINNTSLKELVKQARLGIRGLKTRKRSMGRVPVLTDLKLLDALIRPILTYCCVSYCFMDISDLETMYIGLLKNVLGVRTSTNNDAIYKELGALPLKYYMYCQAIRFWFNLFKGRQDKLSLLTYRLLLMAPETMRGNWAGSMKSLLNDYDEVEAFADPVACIQKGERFLSELFKKIRSHLIWRVEMNIYNSRKLDLYNDIAIDYTNMGICETYTGFSIWAGSRR